MSDKVVVNNSSHGIGAAALLGVAFVVLKLTGYINWSWVWVLAPFWIPFAIVLFVLGAVVVGFVISDVVKRAHKRKRRKIKAESRKRFNV